MPASACGRVGVSSWIRPIFGYFWLSVGIQNYIIIHLNYSASKFFLWFVDMSSVSSVALCFISIFLTCMEIISCQISSFDGHGYASMFLVLECHVLPSLATRSSVSITRCLSQEIIGRSYFASSSGAQNISGAPLPKLSRLEHAVEQRLH